MIEAGTFVVVTTDAQRRGVFGGELVSHDKDAKTAVLKDVRMCVHWDVATRGVLGLASKGPQPGCKITGAVPTIDLDGVSAVMEATEDAKAAWETEPWS